MLKKYWNNAGLLLGLIGMVIFIFGLSESNTTDKNLIILCATALLFGSALIQKEPFFAGLQGIAFVSAIMIFFDLSKSINLSVFVVLSFIFAIFYFSKNKISLANICAFIGLVSLCLGILLAQNQFMLASGLFFSNLCDFFYQARI